MHILFLFSEKIRSRDVGVFSMFSHTLNFGFWKNGSYYNRRTLENTKFTPISYPLLLKILIRSSNHGLQYSLRGCQRSNSKFIYQVASFTLSALIVFRWYENKGILNCFFFLRIYLWFDNWIFAWIHNHTWIKYVRLEP